MMAAILQSSIARLLLGAGTSALLVVAAPMAAEAQFVNTATGTSALFSNTTGSYNTADGYAALFSNTTGSYNTATGYSALVNNTTGSNNTAVGVQALYNNTTGFYNTAAGFNALFSNTTGARNTADGLAALYSNTTGTLNTAGGYSALYKNTTGSYNLAAGYAALYSSTTGSYNIAIGNSAGFYISTGSYNIAIGNSGNSADSGVIRIGTTGKQTRAYMAGVSGVTASSGVQVFVNSSGQLGTLTSSRRFKKDIHSLTSVGDKLLQLRPVSFRYKQAAEGGTYPVQYGLIAEEVARVFPELVQYDKAGKPFTVYYHLLTPLLLSEVQKEHQQNVSQQAKLTQQQAEITQQQARLASFEKRDAQQQAEIASLKQQFIAQQQQQAAQMTALQLKLNQLDRLVQASNPEVRLSQK